MAEMSDSVEQWAVGELVLRGRSDGNPFIDTELSATFAQDQLSLKARGFYDGEGVYRIRFSPPRPGRWRYVTQSNQADLSSQEGVITCSPARGDNHGPVQVAHTFHFAYADGTPYRQIGTTCYAWTHQRVELEEQTLTTLRQSPFNKIRMCVFPKNYAFNKDEPPRYPFEGTPPDRWDFTRFNPAFFRHLEKRVSQLCDLGIQADIILFHPYDEGRWGFDRMDPESDDRYLRYVIARLSAYRNVWWSVANEFDFMKEKRPEDWDRYFRIIQEEDPYGRLCSIHNGRLIYDHNKPWVTHASIQNGSAVEDFGRAALYRDVYRKPIVFDEVKYEGDLPQRWGNITAEEMVHRFWQGTIAGTYVGHGETYLHPQDIIWWARGGQLHGQSSPRLAFLRTVLESAPAEGIDPIDKWQDVRTAGQAGRYYVIYFGREAPTSWLFELPRAGLAEGMRFNVEILDTWNMTIQRVEQTFEIITDGTYRYHARGLPEIPLPGRPWIALRITRCADDNVSAGGEQKIWGEG